MVTCLQGLDQALEKKMATLLFYRIAEEIVAQLSQEMLIQVIFVNRDYTPFSIPT